ncbi:MAG: hypothetical protein ACI4RA_05200 [Kiritimatiellia bacterium]
MTANEIFQDSRVSRVRELRAEVARLNEELAQTRAELDGLRSHFSLALAAAFDAAQLPAGGRLAVIDGWNALLGSASVLTPEEKKADPRAKRERLCAIVRDWLDAHPQDAAWIVFDGARADGHAEGRLRISFTGGEGPHRADRMICDYLRMRRISGAAHGVVVFTEDADFRREAESLGADVRPVGELRDAR